MYIQNSKIDEHAGTLCTVTRLPVLDEGNTIGDMAGGSKSLLYATFSNSNPAQYFKCNLTQGGVVDRQVAR